jgi:hypothetical protein
MTTLKSQAKIPPDGFFRLSLDKMKHFVDSAKALCPITKALRRIRRGELSTK